MSAKDIAKRLKNARLSLGLTQHQMADRLGLPQSKVAKFETGKQTPTAVEIISIQRVFGVQLLQDDLMSGNWSESAKAPGLAALYGDAALCDVLALSDNEGRLLLALSEYLSPGLSKDGYVQLLFTLRAIGGL